MVDDKDQDAAANVNPAFGRLALLVQSLAAHDSDDLGIALLWLAHQRRRRLVRGNVGGPLRAEAFARCVLDNLKRTTTSGVAKLENRGSDDIWIGPSRGLAKACMPVFPDFSEEIARVSRHFVMLDEAAAVERENKSLGQIKPARDGHNKV